mgnify:CR=1 FL=1
MNENDSRYEEARRRVNELRSFYRDLIFYGLINVILVVINLVTSPDRLWFYWVTIFWGIGILMHATTVFLGRGKLLGREWEDKQIRKMLNGDGSKDGSAGGNETGDG